MPIRTCLFDLGNVLVFFSHDRMVQNIVDVSGAAEDHVRQFLFNSRFQAAIETGQLSEEEFHAAFQTHVGCRVGLNDLRHAVGNIFELNEPMVPLLQELRDAGIRLVLLSNTCLTHIEFVRRRWSLLDLFDDITTSWEVGALKPDPLIFESALSQAQCAADECFYTDDIHDYVQQAASMNIQAYLFEDPVTTRDTLRSLGIDLNPSAT